MESLADTAGLFLLAMAFKQVADSVSAPYMDEIFHVPQTQVYCAGNWLQWDDKITTPPGLYVLGWILAKLTGNCDTIMLRAVNAIGLVAGSWIVTRLFNRSLFIYLLTFPLLFFFSLVYYTDIWSTFLVLIGLGLTLRKWYLLSSVLFTVSLAFRQTNIVWAGFAAVCALLDLDFVGLFKPSQGMDSLFYQWQRLFSNVFTVRSVPYAMCAAVFGGFLVWNEGSITLGDKQNHQMALNFPQMLYFCLVSTAFCMPRILGSNWLKTYIKRQTQSKKRILFYVAQNIAIYLVATRLKIVHPFILADNRHYTFYLWRRVLDRPDGLSIGMVPIYHLCIAWMLGPPFSLYTLFYWLGLAAVLVPSPLLEPRYYIVGFLIWRLLISKQPILGSEIVWNSIISIITTHIFCQSKTHFMW